jgi:hypothetical protein
MRAGVHAAEMLADEVVRLPVVDALIGETALGRAHLLVCGFLLGGGIAATTDDAMPAAAKHKTSLAVRSSRGRAGTCDSAQPGSGSDLVPERTRALAPDDAPS